MRISNLYKKLGINKPNLLILIILLSFITLKSQTNPILNTDHIPLLGFGWGSEWMPGLDVNDLAKIKEMGLEGVMFTNLTQDRFDMFQNIQNEVKLFPYQVNDSMTNHINFISYYCDAYYSKWEAVDVTNSNVKATLSFDPNIGMRTNEAPNGIVTIPSADTTGTLIWGPGYRQRIKYAAIDTGNYIDYTTTFRLMIKRNTSFQNPPLSTEGLTDDLCKIIIRVKEIEYDTLDLEYFVKDSLDYQSMTIKVSDLNFNEWKDFSFNFNYSGLDSIYKKSTNKILKMNDKNMFADYVEYVVEWLNVPYARLYFDNVFVSDIRGRYLTEREDERRNIRNQSNNLKPDGGIVFNQNYTDFENTMIGFYGIDEPETIDQLEPIRIVGNLIKEATNNKRFLFTSVAASWDGKYGSSNFGTEALNKVQEFYHRALPDGFIVQTHLYHYPDQNNWVNNIENMFAKNLKELKNTSSTPIVLVQAGKWIPWNTEEPNPSQLDYTVNFALMYGAKGIIVDQLFYKTSDITGIINTATDEVSSLYDEIKNKLSPRLKGLLGKTLKKLTPTAQILDAEHLSWHNFINLLIHHSDGAYGADFDLGFFKDINQIDYFMLINRWYNPGSLDVPLQFTSSNFGNYNNIQLYNLIDSTQTTILNNDIIYPTVSLGDALFFRVAPVIRSGGSLITNETTLPGETLLNDMTIEPGVTLTVNGTYTADANITIKTGGKIVAGPTGKIIFGPNKSITVEGNAEIKGFTNNKLSLEFSNSTAVGVEAQFGSNLSISNCIIKNSIVGIKVENGSTANISYVDFTDCSDNAVVMFGFGNGENAQTLATPTVYRCTIRRCGMGISVVNCSEVVIKENSIIECNLGLYFNMVNSAYISSNNILGWQSNNWFTNAWHIDEQLRRLS